MITLVRWVQVREISHLNAVHGEIRHTRRQATVGSNLSLHSINDRRVCEVRSRCLCVKSSLARDLDEGLNVRETPVGEVSLEEALGQAVVLAC